MAPQEPDTTLVSTKYYIRSYCRHVRPCQKGHQHCFYHQVRPLLMASMRSTPWQRPAVVILLLKEWGKGGWKTSTQQQNWCAAEVLLWLIFALICTNRWLLQPHPAHHPQPSQGSHLPMRSAPGPSTGTDTGAEECDTTSRWQKTTNQPSWWF